VLAQAAACYEQRGTESQPPPTWPAELVWDAQRNPVAALVRAGALYQAEIDRLQHRLQQVIARIDRAREHLTGDAVGPYSVHVKDRPR